MQKDAQDVLHYWFEELAPKQRFAKDDQVDDAIRRRFGPLHAALAMSVPTSWRGEPRSLLAAVIVLDQFSRNLFRGQAAAFAQDREALELTRSALARGEDEGLSAEERQFLYMPLMHSESLTDQEECVRLMERLGLAEAAHYARRHRDIVARFGRFPHRNVALGRASTTDEAAFLREPGSSF